MTLEERASDIASWDTNRAECEATQACLRHFNELIAEERERCLAAVAELRQELECDDIGTSARRALDECVATIKDPEQGKADV